jgi:Uncharacterized conserved protein
MIPADENLTQRIRRILGHLWGRLLTGIVVSVPLVATLWVLNLAYTFIAKISEPIWKALGIESTPFLYFCTTLLLLLGVGFMATHVIGRRVIEAGESLLMRVPLIAPVYSAVKQALEAFRQMKSNPQFKRVAYVEYPSQGCFLIGFVTGQYEDPTVARSMTMVFLPTSPSPLTGFVVAVPTDRVVESSLTLEQATKIIMSGGLVAPSIFRPPAKP